MKTGKKKQIKRNVVNKNISTQDLKNTIISEENSISTNKKNCSVSEETPYENAHVFEDLTQNDCNEYQTKPVIPESPYSCQFCDFQTCFHQVLANHLRRHNRPKPFACSKCSYSSSVIYSLQRHVKLMHEKPENIFCNKCDFKCSSQRQLKNHSVVHSCKNYFKCSECDFKHVLQAGVKRHMIRHLENKYQLMCPFCSYRGVKPEYVAKHVEKYHKFEHNLANSLGVSVCAKENIDTKSSRDSINYQLVKSDIREIIKKQPVVLLKRCDDNIKGTCNSAVNMGKIHEQILQDNFFEVAKCGKPEETIDPELLNLFNQNDDSSVILKSALITKNKNIITSTVKFVYSESSTEPQLDILKSKSEIKGKVIRGMKTNKVASDQLIESSSIALNEVIFNKTNENSKTAKVYQCKDCCFVSTWIDKFETHIKLHSSLLFSCHKCDYVAKSQQQLAKHKLLKHSKKKELKCNKCDYRCSSAQNMKVHLKCHKKVKPFKSAKYSFSTASSNSLKHHMNKHDEEKQFACDLCDFRTRYKYTMRDHRFVHTGETKYVCKICDYKFYRNANLKKHMEVHDSPK